MYSVNNRLAHFVSCLVVSRTLAQALASRYFRIGFFSLLPMVLPASYRSSPQLSLEAMWEVGFLWSISVSTRSAQSPPPHSGSVFARGCVRHMYALWFHTPRGHSPSFLLHPIQCPLGVRELRHHARPASRHPGTPSPVEKSSPRGARLPHPVGTSCCPPAVPYRPGCQPGRPLREARGSGVGCGKGEEGLSWRRD